MHQPYSVKMHNKCVIPKPNRHFVSPLAYGHFRGYTTLWFGSAYTGVKLIMEIEKFLNIEVNLEEVDELSFSVVVTFLNRSNSAVNWEFRNVMGKAESLSFKLYHSNGKRIDPVDGMSGTPAAMPEAPLFEPGATQIHRIDCYYVKDGLLKVGKVHYHPVPKSSSYNISFQYGLVKSNTVQWSSPKI